VVLDSVKILATSGMKAYFVTGLIFKNGSSITVTNGNAITTYNATVSGINLVTGKSSYVIAATVNPANSGSITGAGTFTYGQNITLTATPSAGFSFTKWTGGNTDISTNATLTFTADSDRVIVANFISVATIIKDAFESKTMLMYPNPSHGKFSIYLDNEFKGEITLTVYNEIGNKSKTIKLEKTARSLNYEADFENLPKGIYFITLQANNFNISKKIELQ